MLNTAGKISALIFILVVASQLSASAKKRITVESYSKESGLFVIKATEDGKPIVLLCYQDDPYCAAPKAGDYWLAEWNVPVNEYRGGYVCRDVDLYAISSGPDRARKVGEFCVVEKGENQGSQSSRAE